MDYRTKYVYIFLCKKSHLDDRRKVLIKKQISLFMGPQFMIFNST